MDFAGEKRSVEVDTDKEIRIQILSGDEILINGDNRYDSSIYKTRNSNRRL